MTGRRHFSFLVTFMSAPGTKCPSSREPPFPAHEHESLLFILEETNKSLPAILFVTVGGISRFASPVDWYNCLGCGHDMASHLLHVCPSEHNFAVSPANLMNTLPPPCLRVLCGLGRSQIPEWRKCLVWQEFSSSHLSSPQSFHRGIQWSYRWCGGDGNPDEFCWLWLNFCNNGKWLPTFSLPSSHAF